MSQDVLELVMCLSPMFMSQAHKCLLHADHKLKRKEEERSDTLILVSQGNMGNNKDLTAEKNSADFS